MVFGGLAVWMQRLRVGDAVVLDQEVVNNSASFLTESAFDYIRPEYVKAVIDEINSKEYPQFSIYQKDFDQYVLRRDKVN